MTCVEDPPVVGRLLDVVVFAVIVAALAELLQEFLA